MKHRGRTVGEGGMHQLVSALQQASNAKIHLMGHSFGCVVVSSILNGPEGKGALPRPINSVALVQGAMSLWSYADKVLGSSQPGYFRSVLTRGVVSGPIITTKSRHDTAVGVLYPAAVGLVREATSPTSCRSMAASEASASKGRRSRWTARCSTRTGTTASRAA